MIEIAIVMVIIGLLAGGGISLMVALTQRKARNETIDYLKQAETALISFAGINGRLPWADTSGNGNENNGASSGNLPYQTLKLIPTDPNKRVLKYALNSNLGTDRQQVAPPCARGFWVGPLSSMPTAQPPLFRRPLFLSAPVLQMPTVTETFSTVLAPAPTRVTTPTGPLIF